MTTNKNWTLHLDAVYPRTGHCSSVTYRVIYTIIGMKDHIRSSRRAPRSNLTPPKDLGHIISYTPNQCTYQISTSYTLRFLRYSPDKILQIKVTVARSKVKSRSHNDVAHLHPLTNVTTKYQLPTPYGFRTFRDIAWTRFYRSRSLQQGQIKVTQRRCTPTPPKQCP